MINQSEFLNFSSCGSIIRHKNLGNNTHAGSILIQSTAFKNFDLTKPLSKTAPLVSSLFEMHYYGMVLDLQSY